MAFEVGEAERLLSPGALGRSEKGLLALGAFALAIGVAAWVTDAGQGISRASAGLPASQRADVQDAAVQDQAQDSIQDQAQGPVSFRDRFLGAPSRAGQVQSSKLGSALQALDRTALRNIEGKLWDAKALLAQQLMYGNWRAAAVAADIRPDDIRSSVDDSRQAAAPAAPSGIPLPRPRPVFASADPQGLQTSQPVTQAEASKADGRTLLEKLSDLLPGKVTLASLTTDGGPFRQGPDLAALGYEKQTAVYDISAHAVYLPNRMVLEAHSGMGSLRDDPDHVDRRMVGATPPAVYDLKPREALFHGVAALRMTPANGSSIFGRSGLLAHPYMLGPLGDSNGCVSIRDYDRFLKAYNEGEVSRIVVVPSLNSATATSQRATAQASPS